MISLLTEERFYVPDKAKSTAFLYKCGAFIGSFIEKFLDIGALYHASVVVYIFVLAVLGSF